jgi:uncharacterized membrane protein YidH (DUF202 family)
VVPKSSVGLLLIALGVVLIVIGVLVWVGALSWFGRLPGDIRVERPGFQFYAPIVSMLILSLVLTILGVLIRRFWP